MAVITLLSLIRLVRTWMPAPGTQSSCSKPARCLQRRECRKHCIYSGVRLLCYRCWCQQTDLGAAACAFRASDIPGGTWCSASPGAGMRGPSAAPLAPAAPRWRPGRSHCCSSCRSTGAPVHANRSSHVAARFRPQCWASSAGHQLCCSPCWSTDIAQLASAITL